MLAGGLAGVLLALTLAVSVRRMWPAYLAAEPTKAFSPVMLVARLSAGALCIIVGAWVATRVARDAGTAAVWLGGVVLAISLPNHLLQVWADYPPWYHAVYLAYLVPLAWLTGRGTARFRGG